MDAKDPGTPRTARAARAGESAPTMGLLASQPLRELTAPSAEARALLKELSPLTFGHASIAGRDRLAAARDNWPRTLLWAREGSCGPLPDLVAWPGRLDEVVSVTRRAGELGVPVVPVGGGSSSGGAIAAVRGGIALDLRRMARLLLVDGEALEVECEAGIVGEVLERRLAREGLTLGHESDDARAATVGGWLSTRSAGCFAGRYGKIEDRVASLTAVDGRGEVVVAPRRPLPGWDLAQLFAGSEGCLGTICSARLHVHKLPEARAFQAWRFAGLRAGLEALRSMLRAGLRPAAVQLSDPADLAAQEEEDGSPIGRRGPLRRRFDDAFSVPLARLASRATLFRPRTLNAAARALRACRLLLVFEGPLDLCELESEESGRLCQAARADELGPEPARLWLERRLSARFAVSRVFDQGGFSDVVDLAATWDKALEVHRRVREAVAPLALVRGRIAHAYPEGCSLTFTVSASVPGLEEALLRHEAVWRAALAAARGAGAVASHHGGVGLQRLNAFKGQLGEATRVIAALKATFDPRGIMNPGKLGGG